MEEKAKVLGSTSNKVCNVCLLLDSQAPKGTKFFIYKEGWTNEPDQYICQHCKGTVEEVRKKCNHKIDNPKHKIFENFLPWFVKEIPGMEAKFRKKKEVKKS